MPPDDNLRQARRATHKISHILILMEWPGVTSIFFPPVETAISYFFPPVGMAKVVLFINVRGFWGVQLRDSF